MEKALKFLKEQEKACNDYLRAFTEQDLIDYEGDDELEAVKKCLIEAKEAIAELEKAMKPKTCLYCKHYSQSKFYGDLKVVKYCHENRLGIDDINFQIFYCNKFEPKDNA